jgi:hypothetical protein
VSSAGEDIADDHFWLTLLQRAKFLAISLLEVMVDSTYLTLAYLWFRVVERVAGEFSHVTDVELVMLNTTKIVFGVLPPIMTVWYVIIDFAGGMKRIWEMRRKVKAG